MGIFQVLESQLYSLSVIAGPYDPGEDRGDAGV